MMKESQDGVAQMNTVYGDLIALAVHGEFDVVIHGCNCFCTMGAGIARAVKTEFPEAYQVDIATKKGNREKLGDYSLVTVERNGFTFTIINAYTQYHFHGEGILADYDAIRSVFKKLKKGFSGKHFAFPLIGAGLAGGDWTIISNIIAEELQGEKYTLVKFAP